VIAGYEVTSARSPRWRFRNFPRLTWCAIAGGVFLVIFATVLLALGAFGDFIDFFRTFSRDHPLTGGIPVEWNDLGFAVGVFGVPALIVLSFWYAIARTRAGRALELEDWAMGALVLFLVPYYLKALDRADLPHIRQPWGIAFPLLVYVIARLLAACDAEAARSGMGRAAARWGVTSLVSVLVVTLVGVTATSLLVDQIGNTGKSFLPVVQNGPADYHIGYVDEAVDPGLQMQDLSRVLALGGPDATVFDFSNTPAAFYFLLDEHSPTRYYHVSTAIRAESQDDLVDELARARPDLVVFDNASGGLSSWDGISNAVRHYRVSSYLLDHYEPFIGVDGYTILQRNDLGLDPAAIDLRRFDGRASAPLPIGIRKCEWGRVPEFLDDRPATGAPSRTINVTSSADPGAVSLPTDLTRFRWLELSSTEGIAPGPIALRQGGETLTRLTVGPDRPERLFVSVGSCPQWHWLATPGPAVLSAGNQRLEARLIK
jgi:hypothetical protein